MEAFVYFDHGLAELQKHMEPALTTSGFKSVRNPEKADVRILDFRSQNPSQVEPSSIAIIGDSTNDLIKVIQHDDLVHWTYNPQRLEELLILIEFIFKYEQAKRESLHLKETILKQNSAYNSLKSITKFNASLFHAFDQFADLLQMDLTPESLISRTCDYLSSLCQSEVIFYFYKDGNLLKPGYKTSGVVQDNLPSFKNIQRSDLLKFHANPEFVNHFGNNFFSSILLTNDSPQGIYFFKGPMDSNLRNPLMNLVKFIGLGFDKSILFLSLQKVKDLNQETGLFQRDVFLRELKSLYEEKKQFTWSLIEVETSHSLLSYGENVQKFATNVLHKLPASPLKYQISDHVLGLIYFNFSPGDLLIEFENYNETKSTKIIIGTQNIPYKNLCHNELLKFKDLHLGTIVFSK